MEWYFEDETTLLERQSGFTLHLISGSWAQPVELWPDCCSSFSVYQQAKLLTGAMQFIAVASSDVSQNKLVSA